MNARTRIAAMIVGLSLPGAVAAAGPLTPPAGAVSPTHRTLTEVEPRIPVGPQTTPGDSDLSPSVYKISQPGSYYLTGDVLGEAGKHGIEITAQNVTLDLNGFTVRGVPASLSGILHSGQAQAVRVVNGFVEGWGGRGVCLNQGLIAGTNSVEDLTVRGCGMIGIQVMGSATRCLARDNAGGGFELSGEGVASGCAALENAGVGFYLSGRFIAERCISTGNADHGFILANAPCHVRSCTAQSNGNSGIRVAAHGSVIEGNICRGNGATVADGAGIDVPAGYTDVRVDSNHVTLNDYGIRVDGSASFIIRNTARSNSQNIVVAGVANTYGPIVNTTGQISNTNPWANFAH